MVIDNLMLLIFPMWVILQAFTAIVDTYFREIEQAPVDRLWSMGVGENGIHCQFALKVTIIVFKN